MPKNKDSIPLLSQKKFYFSLIGFGVFCVLYAAIYLWLQMNTVQRQEQRLHEAQKFAQKTILKRKKRDVFLSRYVSADPQFIDYELETFSFLEKERNALEPFLHHPAFRSHPVINQRFDFLKKGENVLRFVEEDIQSTKMVRETIEKQLHPIEVQFEDLDALLYKIESSSDSPQLIITDFQLKKKKTPLKNEVFELQMQIISREFIKKPRGT